MKKCRVVLLVTLLTSSILLIGCNTQDTQSTVSRSGITTVSPADDFGWRVYVEGGSFENFCEVLETYRDDLHPDNPIDRILTLGSTMPSQCKYESMIYTEYGSESDALLKPLKWRFFIEWGDYNKNLKINMEWFFDPQGDRDSYSLLLKKYVLDDEDKQVYRRDNGDGSIDYLIFIGDNSVVNASLECDPQDLDSFRTHLFDHIFAMENVLNQ